MKMEDQYQDKGRWNKSKTKSQTNTKTEIITVCILGSLITYGR